MPPKTASLNLRNPDAGAVFTVRALPPPVTHKSFLRAHIHHSALASFELKSGEPCQIYARDSGDDNVKWWPAISWLAADPFMPRHITLLSEPVRRLVSVELEEKVMVRRYKGEIKDADKLVIREIMGEGGGATLMRAGDRDGWRHMLEHTLMETKYAFEGLVLASVDYKRYKRSFRVEKVTAAVETPAGPGIVPAFLVTESTAVKLFTETIAEPTKKAKPKKTEGAANPNALASKTPGKASEGAVVKPPVPVPKITFESIGGLSRQVGSLRALLACLLEDADEFSSRDLIPPRGVLLYGPPGTGKTLIMKATANETNARAYIIDGKVMGKYQGESEAAIRKIFADARKNQPSIIFMDEVDSLAPKRSQAEGSDGKIVSTLLTEMDQLESVGPDGAVARVAIVAATNRPNSIDEALRRAGRFEKELEIGIPDVDARREILSLLTRKLEFESQESGKTKDECIAALAARTHGYVGADLEAVARGAFALALNRRRVTATTLADAVASISITDGASVTERKSVAISERDLETALREVKPTAMREIFIEPPKVRWSDIGGQEEVKQSLREAVEWPLTHPEVFARLGGTPRKGILLYGPPGCSKTLTAKALATEAGLNFMAVKGPELLSMYVGESERAVREIFRKARAASPSIIFFDEIDALTASREGSKGGGVNVLTALLNEMDGIETLKNVVVLAATNRPEIMDPALMRPGRLDTILYVGPPDFDARREILKIKTNKMSIDSGVDITELAERLDGFSGAEIVNICDEAIHYAMRESFDIEAVTRRHFGLALERAVPQITAAMRRKYEDWSVGGVKKI